MNFAKYRVFVDEYGNTGLDLTKLDVSHFYIVSAVLIDDANYPALLTRVEEVRRQHFQSGEMKSSSIGSNTARRKRILTALAALNFRFYAVAVDKREISSTSGLIYKQSFIKFLAGLLYRQLLRSLGNVEIVADEQGSPDFMEGFRTYVEKKHRPDLFSTVSMRFAASHSEPLLQLADIVAGTLGRCLDPTKTDPEAPDYLQILHPNTVLIETWPPIRQPLPLQAPHGTTPNWDFVIRDLAVSQATLFILANRDTNDEDVQVQVECAKYLLYYSQFVNSKSYLSAAGIIRALEERVGNRLTDRRLRAVVISKMRDAGVLVASGPKGYKLPVSETEVRDFVEDARTRIEPLAHRVGIVRNKVRLATAGDVDVLDGPIYAKLRYLVDGRVT